MIRLGHLQSHIRFHASRMERERHDSLFGILGAYEFRESEHGILAGLVPIGAWSEIQPSHRTQIDNRLPPSLQHQRQQRSRHEIHALDINLPVHPPLHGVRLRDGLERAEKPGIVDQDIQPSKSSLDLLRRALNALLARDVHFKSQDLGRFLPIRLGRRRDLLLYSAESRASGESETLDARFGERDSRGPP